jgi:hypothetical protein
LQPTWTKIGQYTSKGKNVVILNLRSYSAQNLLCEQNPQWGT